MARPLRIEKAGGGYHVTARGNERNSVYREDRDREHFLELLAEMVLRFRVRLHCLVLMDNHYHWLLELSEPNLSRTVQWLNVSYSVWFNRRPGRSGHWLRGRFKSVAVSRDECERRFRPALQLSAPCRLLLKATAGFRLRLGDLLLAARGGRARPGPLMRCFFVLLLAASLGLSRNWADQSASPREVWTFDVEPLQTLNLKSRADGGVVRMGGFPPWPFKYTSHGQAGRHGGVPTEWEYTRLISQFNAYQEADAAGLGSMANASFYQHYPLKSHYSHPNPKPTLADWRARGWVSASGKVAPGLLHRGRLGRRRPQSPGAHGPARFRPALRPGAVGAALPALFRPVGHEHSV
jgi:REP element-mobilizing transposase RayT